jgi:hypothetical protein
MFFKKGDCPMDVGPWIGSLMVIAAFAMTVLLGKFLARLHERVRRENEAKSKGQTAYGK